MGNLVYLPGSHNPDYEGEHTGHDQLPGERSLCVSAGTMTISHASLWHRVEANTTDHTRLNIFLSYTPSWITGYYRMNTDWLSGLTREQQIILRGYDLDKELFSRPPAEDLPLFEDGDVTTHAEAEPHKIRRRTRYERHLREVAQP